MYSIDKLVDAIDDHPLRWEVITLESALSLPTLSIRRGEPCVDFFFYPVGGVKGSRTLGLPYYLVSGTIKNRYEATYEPIASEILSGICPSERILGPADLGDISREEYDERVKELYKITESLIPVYFNFSSSVDSLGKKDAIEKYYAIFEQISLKPLVPAYKTLNSSFFKWLEQ